MEHLFSEYLFSCNFSEYLFISNFFSLFYAQLDGMKIGQALSSNAVDKSLGESKVLRGAMAGLTHN